jgi:hypothetical protein
MSTIDLIKLQQHKEHIASYDEEYSEKVNNEKLFDFHKKDMEKGCEDLVEKLKNIHNADIMYKKDISDVFFTKEEKEKYKDKKYFYTQCWAMKHFMKTLNKNHIWLTTDKPFVNKIRVNEDKIKSNTIQYDLIYDEITNDVWTKEGTKYGYRSYYKKVPVYPSPENTFFGFN